MPKTVPLSKFQEWKALDRISPIVHEMKCVFREITKDDFGIDGEVEIVTPKPGGQGFQITGGIIKVQAKSGKSYVKQDSDSSFSTTVTKSDLELWYNANVPTIFIVYHPDDDRLYWKEIRSYVRNTPNVWLPPFKIVFNKYTDEFTSDCYDSLCKLADVSPPRISSEGKEKLFSNLLKIRQLPWVWSAPVGEHNHGEIWRDIRAFGGFVPPFQIFEKRIYSLSNLNDKDCTLRGYYDTSDIRQERREPWWQDEDLKRLYVSLLNRLLGIHLYRSGIVYNNRFGRYYFPRENEESLEFRRTWCNIRTKKHPQRAVVKFYEYGKDRFWRHKAVDLNFRMIGNSWFLQIIPKYFFTEDGKVPYDSSRVGSLTTRIKAQEANANVLNDVLFWVDMLSGGNVDTDKIEAQLDFKVVMVIEKMPVSGIANFSIPMDPAIHEEPEPNGQLYFLNLFSKKDEDEDED